VAIRSELCVRLTEEFPGGSHFVGDGVDHPTDGGRAGLQAPTLGLVERDGQLAEDSGPTDDARERQAHGADTHRRAR
jgi:hypothetical protein